MGNSASAGPRGLHAPLPHHQFHPHGSNPQYSGLGRNAATEHRWPRIEPPVKVLPQPPPPLALRNTPNGTILQQGGTISQRPQNAGVMIGRRPRSSSAHRLPEPEPLDLARCGSEPDLRAHSGLRTSDQRDPRHHHMARGRKKYKAPPAPHPSSGVDSSSPDMNGWEVTPRKARLFKTRAETNRRPVEDEVQRRVTQTLPRPDLREERPSRPELREELRSRDDCHSWKNGTELREQAINRRKSEGVTLPRVESRRTSNEARDEPPSLQRSKSQDALLSQQFQAELVEAAKKIRHSAFIPRHANGRESSSPELPIEQVLRQTPKDCSSTLLDVTKDSKQPANTFYFGMEESNKTVVNDVNANVNKTNREHRLTAVEKSKNFINKQKRSKEIDDEALLENFVATYHKRQEHSVSGTSSMGSDPEPEEVEGIALQLRPTLPKKQLEIPRFSPTAAWRLLSSDVSPVHSPLMLDEGNLPESVQLSLDKSADSGISGDASPGGGHESSSELVDCPPKAIHYHHQSQKSLLLAWTPEQDLEESSSEEETPSPNKILNAPGAKLTTRGQLFSTLPRERLEDDESGSLFNSLRRPTSQPSDSNWLLSRSVPGSLNNGHAQLTRSTSSPPSPEQALDEQGLMSKYPSYSYLAQGGHVVYLPSANCDREVAASPRSHRNKLLAISGNLSRSCEDVCADMQHEIKEDSVWSNQTMTEQRPNKKKKFTFQSTVRLIENRRLAERLSKEAELKETQRLSELEAMRRVEEEFQRKRAREKANIRHQLRLFSLEEKDYQSLPPLEWGRAEPDGAPASLPSATQRGAPTQVLSEYRETTRDYRDYPHTSRNSPDMHSVEATPRKNFVKHPRIVADIPKNLPVYVSAQNASGGAPSPRPRDNYRKEFAHGAAARKNSSDSDSQPRTRPQSRLAPTRTRSESRSRSVSPAENFSAKLRRRSRSGSPTQQGIVRSVSGTSLYSTPTVSRSASPDTTRPETRSSGLEVSISPIPLVQPWSERNESPWRMIVQSVRQQTDQRMRSRSSSPNVVHADEPNTKSAEVGFVKPRTDPIPCPVGLKTSSRTLPRDYGSHSKSPSMSPKGSLPKKPPKSSSESPVDQITGSETREISFRKSRSKSPLSTESGSPGRQRSRSSSPLRKVNVERPVAPPRILLAAVQPFNKTTKSFRPVNFTPNVAQIVS